jgi:cellulose synthase/poly-beta-1,6-N-acetylglucosamine synthase-like glycosyltransferase
VIALGVSITAVVLTAVFVVTQALYLITLVHDLYMLARKVDWVELDEQAVRAAGPLPKVVLLYPVLREPPETMRTTFVGLDELEYERDRYRIVAIPNHDDHETIAALEGLQDEFGWLEILVVPPTTDPGWDAVWQSWERTEQAYWWHLAATCRRRRPASCSSRSTRSTPTRPRTTGS